MSIRPDAVPAGERPALWTRDFILVCLFVVFIFISFQMLMPTIPVFVQQMGGTPLMVGLVNGVFTISALALRPWIGLALDRHGRKLIWMIGTFVFVLATFGYIWALTIPLLFLMRIIHGAGWGVVTTASATAGRYCAHVQAGGGNGLLRIRGHSGHGDRTGCRFLRY